ncbi:MAG: peptidylprolyl isomerase [Dehalococcoidia bacterium]
MLQPGDAPRAPVGALDTSKSYAAVFKTEKGDITVELFDDGAPLTVENFINLARIGYYDDTTFHRVIGDFMAQGGDPQATGGGGPGYQFDDELSPELRHDSPGILSMANSGPNTNGSQFFITHVATPHLDGYDANGNLKQCGQVVNNVPQSCHAVFGKVTDGMDVLLGISERDPSTATQPGDNLTTIEIIES